MGEAQVKHAVNSSRGFEEAVAHDCRQRGVDGVVCGHIHHAEITEYDGIATQLRRLGRVCTALVEDESGVFHLIRWADE